MTQEVLVKEVNTVAAYDPFRAQLAELKEGNSKAVFDYRDPKGNKEARSHIYKLRQTKAAVDKVRKAEKESSLAYGRLVDSQAKEIVTEIEGMIAVHEEPIKAIEAEEAARVQRHKDGIAAIEVFLNQEYCSMPSVALSQCLARLEELTPTEAYEEFMSEAVKSHRAACLNISALYDAAVNREEEQAELERLRKEAAEREQAEREARIAAEAKAKAEAEAKAAAERREREIEEAAQAAKAEAERREQEHKAALAKAEREKQEAIEQAELKAKRDAEQAKLRQEAEAKALADAEAKRAADVKHRKTVNGQALKDLTDNGINETTAKAVVELIAKGLISHVWIKY